MDKFTDDLKPFTIFNPKYYLSLILTPYSLYGSSTPIRESVFILKCFSQKFDKIINWPPRVQVAGVSSLEEALFCASIGVDALGFTLILPSGPHDGLTPTKARHIIDHLPDGIIPVLITYLDLAVDAAQLVRFIRAKAIQFHGGINQNQFLTFKRLCPDVKTIGRVSISDDSSVDHANTFDPHIWDTIILDSIDPITGKKGATGLVHDWNISVQIVKNSPLPVILAGGLTSENVTQAIFHVRPAGVDAHTGLEDVYGNRDFSKIYSFTSKALKAFHQCIIAAI